MRGNRFGNAVWLIERARGDSDQFREFLAPFAGDGRIE